MNRILDIDFNQAVVTNQSSDSATLWHLADMGGWEDNAIYYEAGDLDDRKAAVVDGALVFDVTNPAIVDPHWNTTKGRIQLGVPINSGGMTEYKRFMLSPRMGSLPYYSAGGWFTIAEQMMGHYWHPDTYGARIHTNLISHDGLLYLVFGMTCKPANSYVWDGYSWTAPIKAVHIPVGQWVELITYYKEGDQDNGRYVVYIRKPGDIWRKLCDVTGFTYNPDGPVTHCTHHNPCKIYADGSRINHVRDAGGSCQILWDKLFIETGDE